MRTGKPSSVEYALQGPMFLNIPAPIVVCFHVMSACSTVIFLFPRQSVSGRQEAYRCCSDVSPIDLAFFAEPVRPDKSSAAVPQRTSIILQFCLHRRTTKPWIVGLWSLSIVRFTHTLNRASPVSQSDMVVLPLWSFQSSLGFRLMESLHNQVCRCF